ncbi:hypothetical protein JMJ77_0010779 [Colletotrichum scovillei]|uniref:Uncharacterized protein n=1 Tax=Colletotrichum scovillei TaxID=1209932 RepID=A0A9P7R278_9PEZI|nr:hypothetical protein JMJ77_0010779 [Colletotrichum scovillei]KAG7059746.1 hypothetical protein JMJ78_0015035 [Colletotrichum scovillei]KAG7067192.1 hypothetical protein JMJ76_0008635 [Colletotrichum scovillei]
MLRYLSDVDYWSGVRGAASQLELEIPSSCRTRWLLPSLDPFLARYLDTSPYATSSYLPEVPA